MSSLPRLDPVERRQLQTLLIWGALLQWAAMLAVMLTVLINAVFFGYEFGGHAMAQGYRPAAAPDHLHDGHQPRALSGFGFDSPNHMRGFGFTL